MMVVMIILVWGGLVVSTVLLRVLPNTWGSQGEESSSHKE